MSADVTEFQATEAYSSLDLIKVKYKNNKQSSVAMEYVTVRTRSNNLTDWWKI